MKSLKQYLTEKKDSRYEFVILFENKEVFTYPKSAEEILTDYIDNMKIVYVKDVRPYRGNGRRIGGENEFEIVCTATDVFSDSDFRQLITSKKDKQLKIRCNDKLLELLGIMQDMTGQSQSNVITEALVEYYNKQKMM